MIRTGSGDYQKSVEKNIAASADDESVERICLGTHDYFLGLCGAADFTG